MKISPHNTLKISVILIGIFFVVALWLVFFKDNFLGLLVQELDHSSSNKKNGYWKISHITSKDVVADGVSCDLTYPIFSLLPPDENIGNKLFGNIFTQGQDNSMIQKCEWKLSTPIFQSDWWGYSSGVLTLIFSWWISSVFSIDRAFDTNGYLLVNDYNFHIDRSHLMYDLSPYFGRNIIHLLSWKIEQMNLEGRIIAPNERERILFFRKPPSVAWPSDWTEIRFIWSEDSWHIVLPSNLIKRYGWDNTLVHPNLGEKVLSLTFDDGPSKEYTPVILDILKTHHIKATFCILWSQAVKYPELVRRIYEEWHEICNHSITHSSFTSIRLDQVQDEIVRNEKIINDVLAMSMIIPFVRPPYGAVSLDMERELNTPFALWSVDTIDWKDNRPKSILKRASMARSGDIVLFHDIHPGVTKILGEYILKYTSDWYSFATLSQMMGSWSLSDISGQSLFGWNKVRYLHNQK